jgi:hypothetical protein
VCYFIRTVDNDSFRPLLSDPRTANTLRKNWRGLLSACQDEIWNEILTLLKTAKKEDTPRVTLACKILDKALPDLREYLNSPGRPYADRDEQRPVQIVIGGEVKRGQAWAGKKDGRSDTCG